MPHAMRHGVSSSVSRCGSPQTLALFVTITVADARDSLERYLQDVSVAQDALTYGQRNKWHQAM